MSRTRPFSCRRCGLPCFDLQGLRAHECQRGPRITTPAQATTAIGDVLAGLTTFPPAAMPAMAAPAAATLPCASAGGKTLAP